MEIGNKLTVKEQVFDSNDFQIVLLLMSPKNNKILNITAKSPLNTHQMLNNRKGLLGILKKMGLET